MLKTRYIANIKKKNQFLSQHVLSDLRLFYLLFNRSVIEIEFEAKLSSFTFATKLDFKYISKLFQSQII